MPSFLINKFNGGISDFEDRGISGAFKMGSGLDIRNKKGSLKAQQGLVDDLALGNIMDDRVVQAICASDGYSWWGLYNGKILRRNNLGAWALKYTDPEEVLTGLAEWVNDNGEYGLYWATQTKLHRSATNGDFGDVDADAGSPAQTYPKTNLQSNYNHRMSIVNGTLLIANENLIALVGYDESYTNDALQLIPGNVAQSIIDDGTYAKIVANRSDNREESWMYVWDNISLNYNDREPLPFSDINSMIKSEIILVQYGTDGQIYFFGDTSKLPIISIPGGGQTMADGAEIDGGLALFGVYGGTNSGIYSYGRKRKNDSFCLNLEYPLVCDEISSVMKVGTDIFVAYKYNDQYGVKKVSTTSKVPQAIYKSLDLKLPPDKQIRRQLSICEITMLPLPENCSIELWRRLDKVETGGTDYLGNDTGEDDGWFQCSTQDGDGEYSTTGGTEAVFNLGDKARVVELMVKLNTYLNETPEVLSIQLFFD